VSRELAGLNPLNAEAVARHLVSAGLLLDSDPERALQHAEAAQARAGRLAVVREACGLAAYATGNYALARTHLQAARRIGGIAAGLAVLADCERALGHPERALEIAATPQARALDAEERVELAIVVSGVRRDLGQGAAAVAGLEGPDLDSGVVQPWTARLWYAYAEALLSAHRAEDARRWFAAAATIDEHDDTDAAERAALLPADPPHP
jgi:tetratricopeptide (TPR) repeat protein